MDYPKRQVAIAFGDVKQAYLYFDFVIPVYIEEGFPSDLRPTSIPRRYVVRSPAYFLGADYSMGDPANFLGADYSTKIKKGNLHPEILNRIGKKRFDILQRRLPEFFRIDHGRSAIPFLVHAINELARDLSRAGYDPVIVIDHSHLNLRCKSGLETIAVISSNVAEIDVSGRSWDQLREFRIDDDSRRALRNYRLFWFENYSQKSPNFIEDDLTRRFEALENACRKHGFDVTLKTLGNLLNSKSLLSTAAISLVAALTRQPHLLGAALTTGISVEVGRITLEIAKARLEHREFLRHNDLLYLYNLKKKFYHIEV